MSYFLKNVLGQIKEVCRIKVLCLLIGTREYAKYENPQTHQNLLCLNILSKLKLQFHQ